MTARPKLCNFCRQDWILALLLVATLELIVMARPARAGEDAWTPFGPGGGALQSLTASPRGELYVTASFSTAEIWQLPLPTVPWRWRNNGIGRPAVTALAVDPKSPNSLWAVSGTALQSVFHSNDEAHDVDGRQELARGQARDLTRQRQDIEKRGDDLRRRIASHLRGTFGFTSEQLIQFGVNPRPRVTRRKKTPAEAKPAQTSTTPTASK